MGIARGLERRLERLVDGLAARIFRGRIHPVELGSALVREADLALFDTPGGKAAPNRFELTMGGELLESDVVAALERELSAFFEETALERGWRLEGAVRVAMQIDPVLRPSELQVVPTVAPDELPVWAVLKPIERDADELAVRHNRSVVGRSRDADLVVSRPDVSRMHAVFWRQAAAAFVQDLGSSNGTAVNGVTAQEPTEITEGDLLTLGQTEYVVSRP